MSGRSQVVIIGALLLGSILFRHSLLFVLSLSLLLVAAAVWLWERTCLNQVEHRRSFSQQRAFFGEEIDLTIEVVNRKLLPLAWLVTEDTIPTELAPRQGWVTPTYTTGRSVLMNLLSLRWYERVRRHYRIHCDVRGEHIFGPALLRSGDIFGFTSREVDVPTLTSLLIYPKVVPITHLGLPAKDPFGDRATRQWLFQDPLRTVGVRDYVPGDSPRRIHWAATARTQALQVKLYEPTTTYQLGLFLNLNTAGDSWWWQGYLPDLAELAITVAASISQWAIDQSYQVGLYANGKARLSEQRLRIMPSRDPEQLPHILEGLARVLPFATMPLEQLLHQESHHLPYGATLVVITAILNAEIAGELLALRAAGHQVTLLVIGDQARSGGLPGIRTHRIGNEQAWRELNELAIGTP